MSFFKKITAMCLIGVCALTGSVFANNSNAQNNQTLINQDNDKETRGVLYYNYNISGTSATHQTPTFAASNNNSKNINVSFTNDSNAISTVTFYKKGLFSSTKIGSFNVNKKSSTYKQFRGEKSSSYYVVVTNNDGTHIKGSLKVRQLD